MTSDLQHQPRSSPAGLVLLGALVLVAAALRFWQLGEWGFEGDEIYTLRDSLDPRAGNPRPLIYLLNHYVIGAFTPLDELGLRLIPAIAGVLAIPALYFITQRLLGTRAALFSALLLTFHAMHVHQSQYARYWSLVFLLSAVYPYALYLGFREHHGRWLALGLVTGVLAALAHPVSVLLVGGLGLFAVLNLKREDIVRIWSRRSVRWLSLLVAILVLVGLMRSFGYLQDWIMEHDTSTRIADHLRDGPRRQGIRQITILMGFLDALTLPVALTGAVGIYYLWQSGPRVLGLLLACLAVVPTAIILLLSSRTAVSLTYLTPVMPAMFMGAGYLLHRLAEVRFGLRPQWLWPATLAIVVIGPGMPTLISQYRDGRRWDLRGAAQWLRPRLGNGDVIHSVQSRVVGHYLRNIPVEPLAPDSTRLEEASRELRRNPGQTLWIVSPAPSNAFRSDLKRGGLIWWLYENCQLRQSLGRGRLDFRQQYLHIYRCPPAGLPPGQDQAVTAP
jgi:hypothetical protein